MRIYLNSFLTEYWEAKYIYDSAYHPVSNEQVFLPGRMCFQAPGNTALTLLMLTFYKTPVSVFGAQFINQSFNSTVNYCNSPKPVFKIQVFFYSPCEKKSVFFAKWSVSGPETFRVRFPERKFSIL